MSILARLRAWRVPERLPGSTRAFRRLARAAGRGRVPACFLVGRCYMDGVIVPRCPVEAARWLRRAAQAGHAGAQHQLATLLVQRRAAGGAAGPFAGELVPDLAEAASWAAGAAQQGVVDAFALYGWLLLNGPPDITDPTAAESWYRRAAEAGNAEGALGLGTLLAKSARDATERQAAAAAVSQAAEAGLPPATYLLGLLKEAGVGLPTDRAAAIGLIRDAARKGHGPAQTRWGLMLLQGRGVTRDVKAGQRWLRRAVQSGDAEAAALLGDLNRSVTPDGQPPDICAAGSWYRRAARMGHPGATRLLQKDYSRSVIQG